MLHAGLAGAYPLVVATTAFLSEILLVAAGIGEGWALSLATRPDTVALLQAAGATFVAWMGVGTLRRRGNAPSRAADAASRSGLAKAILAMLGVTWLNPLAYIEVVFMLGIITAEYASTGKLALAAGFLLASVLKFYGLAMVAGRFAMVFDEPRMRRRFDLFSGLILLGIAALLAAGFIAWKLRWPADRLSSGRGAALLDNLPTVFDQDLDPQWADAFRATRVTTSSDPLPMTVWSTSCADLCD